MTDTLLLTAFLIQLVAAGILISMPIVYLVNRRRRHEAARLIAKRPPQIGLLEQAGGLRELLEAGRYEEAIDLYRRFTGVDLYSARAAVEELRAALLLDHLNNVDAAMFIAPASEKDEDGASDASDETLDTRRSLRHNPRSE